MIKRVLNDHEKALIPKEAGVFFEKFLAAGKQIYLVGGAVRSILLGETPSDLDFTTDATPEEIQKILLSFDTFCDNPYGTVGVVLRDGEEKQVVEITPFRSESEYEDHRRPEKVEFGVSLAEDVIRRDFTINAIVIGPDDEDMALIDYVGGIKDLEEKIIRTVGKAEERFRDDALRMMRAIRFATKLSFEIEKGTMIALSKNAFLLEKISKERVRDEFMKILATDDPATGVQLLVDTGLMTFIIPELLEGLGLGQTGHHLLSIYDHLLESLRQCPSSNPLIRLATLLHDIGKPRTRRLRCKKCGKKITSEMKTKEGRDDSETLYKCGNCGNSQTEHQSATFYGHEVVGARMTEEIADRLRFSKKEKEKLVTLVRWHMFSVEHTMSDSAIRRFIRRVGKENISDMILLRMADRKGGRATTTSWRLTEFQKRVGEQLFEPMTISDMKIDGYMLMKELDLTPGPILGKVLKQIFEEVLEDTSKNTYEYLLGRAKELTKK